MRKTDWPIVRLGDHVAILSGFAFDSAEFSDQFSDQGDMPLVRIRDVARGRSRTYYSGNFDQRYVVADGDLLIGMDGQFNIVQWRGGPALLNQRVCGIKTAARALDERYMYRFLPSALKTIEDGSSFVTVKHLFVKQIREIRIPPSLPEQRRIAGILDRADELRAQRRSALTLLDTLPQSIFTTMYGDQAASSDFESHSLGNHVTFVTSGGRDWAKYYSDSGAPFIRSLDVQMNQLSRTDLAFVDPPDGAESKRTRVGRGDDLLTITGSRIGRVAAVPADWPSPSYISQHVAIIRLDHASLCPDFVASFLSLPHGGQAQIRNAQYGQTKPGLNFNQIRSFTIPVPPLPLQQEFARRIEAVERLKESHRKSLVALDVLFASLQYRAFRGEL